MCGVLPLVIMCAMSVAMNLTPVSGLLDTEMGPCQNYKCTANNYEIASASVQNVHVRESFNLNFS